MPDPARHAFLRAVILFVCGFGLASLALGGGAYLYARQELARRLDDSLAARMAALEQTFGQGGRPALLRAIDSYTEQGVRTFGYALRDRSGLALRQIEGVPAEITRPSGAAGEPLTESHDGQHSRHRGDRWAIGCVRATWPS